VVHKFVTVIKMMPVLAACNSSYPVTPDFFGFVFGREGKEQARQYVSLRTKESDDPVKLKFYNRHTFRALL